MAGMVWGGDDGKGLDDGVKVDLTPQMFMEAQVGSALSQAQCLVAPHRVSVRGDGNHIRAGGPVLGCTRLYEPCSPVSRGAGPPYSSRVSSFHRSFCKGLASTRFGGQLFHSPALLP